MAIPPKIQFEPKADETYKIANVADFIANKLYHKFIRHGSISGYDDSLIVLDVKYYYTLFRNTQKSKTQENSLNFLGR